MPFLPRLKSLGFPGIAYESKMTKFKGLSKLNDILTEFGSSLFQLLVIGILDFIRTLNFVI